MNRLAIVHFQPIEAYPPLMNLLHFIAGSGRKIQVEVYTMYPASGKLFETPSADIRIVRNGKITKQQTALSRYLNYFFFYFFSILRSTRWRPGKFLVFETLSILPVACYKSWINKKVDVMIHYHEYVSPAEYAGGMKLSRWLHNIERKLYPSVKWLSHTNVQRMEKFLADNKDINIPNTFILPNYPPKSWSDKVSTKSRQSEAVTRVVYVGALSMDTMFTREFHEWVSRQKGKLAWDIYSDNITAEAKSFIEDNNSAFIRYKGAVPYYRLPDILKNYEVGVILYNGHIPNYVFNAPNKLFEYLACGLDVWFPDVMTGSHPYITENSFPKVSALDFQQLDKLGLNDLTKREGMAFKLSPYYYEAVLPQLLNTIDATS